MKSIKLKTIFLIFAIFLGAGFIFAFKLGTKINGWNLDEKLQFNPDNLYDHIDGDSDSFLSFGFKGLDVFYYKKGKRELIVEIYDMGSPLNALGVFRSRMGIPSCPCKYGLESEVSENEIVFIKGKYYVKLYTYDVWKGIERDLDMFAKNILKRINTPLEYPEEFKRFPVKNLVPCSFAYYPENYLNIKGFKNVYEAVYRFKTSKVKVFYTEDTYPGKLESVEIEGNRVLKGMLPSGRILYFVKKDGKLWGTDSKEGLSIITGITD